MIRNDKDLYFIKIDSAKSLMRYLYDEESQYEVSARDVEIQIDSETGTYAEGILLTFCKENVTCSYIEMIISNVLGTYISDLH